MTDLEILMIDNLFKMVTKIIEKSLFQNIKWERAIGKPIASKIEPILILGPSPS